jgi:hypothetical protein
MIKCYLTEYKKIFQKKKIILARSHACKVTRKNAHASDIGCRLRLREKKSSCDVIFTCSL